MSAVVTCGQCGAPHAGPDGVTRFECDFCGATIQVDSSPAYEELVCPTPFDAVLCEDSVRRELAARGYDEVELRTSSPRWIAVWQATSSEGEEQVQLVRRGGGGPFDKRLGLPTLPLQERRALEAVHFDDLPPEAPINAKRAHEAARSCFNDPSHLASHLRLVWFRVIDLCIAEATFTQGGIYVIGGDRVFLPELTRVRKLGPSQPALLGRFGVFVLTSFVIAVLVANAWTRAVLLVLLVAIAYTAEFLSGRDWRSR